MPERGVYQREGPNVTGKQFFPGNRSMPLSRSKWLAKLVSPGNYFCLLSLQRLWLYLIEMTCDRPSMDGARSTRIQAGEPYPKVIRGYASSLPICVDSGYLNG